jgi:pimeloyl-ACP methyl ester carboxylesterase
VKSIKAYKHLPRFGSRPTPRDRITRLGRDHPVAAAGVVAVAALAVSAVVNYRLAKSAERANPPRGRFLEIDGARLHYVERGEGPTLVLLHGNGSMIQDFESSGLLEEAAKSYRVIAFDRPGYGHSSRPRDVIWTPDRQAELIDTALERIGAGPAIVLGHSWGASVAVALGLRHPARVKALVLASGYYYPTARLDVVAMSGPAIPILGDILRYTLAPLASRVLWPAALRKIFGPREVPGKFTQGFPEGLAVRPSQLRASAAESALMIPDALHFRDSYADLGMPVAIIAGVEDRLVDTAKQSSRLHRELPRSTFHAVAGAGHMIHQTDTEAVITAINEVAGVAARAPMLSAIE